MALRYKKVGSPDQHGADSNIFLGKEMCVFSSTLSMGGIYQSKERTELELLIFRAGGQLVEQPCKNI